VTEQQLADAFQQATVQAQKQSISTALAQAVANGTITQAVAADDACRYNHATNSLLNKNHNQPRNN
jgi:hypothetical protein